MDTKIFRVTPAIARDWLKRNTGNRALRRGVVEGFKSAFSRGEYLLTHQGIAFAQDGRLLDGQHRLTAISEMPESWYCEMNVSRGLSEGAFQAIDIGLKRSNSDILSIPHGLAAVGRFFATVIDTERGSAITPQYLLPFIDGARAHYETLTGYCGSTAKIWGSAPVRCAAILRIVGGGDADYVLANYHALNHSDYAAMSPVVQGLHKQHAQGGINTRTTDIFIRAYKAFDTDSATVGRLQIKNPSSYLTDARAIILREILGQKKAARTNSVAKKANGAHPASWAATL